MEKEGGMDKKIEQRKIKRKRICLYKKKKAKINIKKKLNLKELLKTVG